MSKLNGDRARFQKDRKRRLRLRERIHAVMARLQKPADTGHAAPATPRTAS